MFSSEAHQNDPALNPNTSSNSLQYNNLNGLQSADQVEFDMPCFYKTKLQTETLPASG